MTAGIAHRFPVDLRNGFCIRVQQDGGALRAYLDLSDATLTEGLQASTAMSLVYEAATGKVGFLPYAAGGGGDASFPSGGAAGQVLRVATASPRALEWGDTDTAIVATGDGQNTELRLLGRRDGAQTQSVRTGPQTVVHSPAPALGNTTTRGSLVVQAETVEETRAEFLGSYHLLSTKGKSSPHGSADKVALFAGATGRLGSSDLWSLNTVVTADANAGDITLMGYELDCNNQSRHYGDAFGPTGAVAERNFYGLLITGVGTYRKTAAIAITDVVDGAWNRGMVAITGAISATGSFIQDLCNGHQASIDILGAPTYGVRQTSTTTKNWFNGSSIFGGQGIVDPAAKLHVEAGALGGGVGQSLEIFRAGVEAGPNGTERSQLRLTAFRTANGALVDTSLLRLRSFAKDAGGAWLDFGPGGQLSFANGGGTALAIGADRTLDASGNRLTGLPAPAAASDAATKAYVDAAGGGAGKVDKADPQMAAPPFVTFPAPALVTSVPQSAIDQNGVLNLGHLSGMDLNGNAPMDSLVQKALDAIATKIANRIPSRAQDGDRSGGALLFPMGSSVLFRSGVTFGADGNLAIIGGTGHGRNNAYLRQECSTLFNLTNSKTDAAASSNMHIEIGGLRVIGAFNNCTPFLIREPEAVNIHDIRYVSEGGRDSNNNPLYYAGTLFRFRNLRTSFIENIYARNDHGLGTSSDINGIAFNLAATVGSTDNHFQNMTLQGFVVGFNCVTSTYPAVEGTLCENVTLVGCNSGIIWSAAGATYPDGQVYVPPQFQFINGHMNCYKEWCLASGVADVLITNNELEIFGNISNGTARFPNDNAITLSNVNRFDISHNTMTSGRAGSLIVGAGNTVLGRFAHNKGIAEGTTAVQQWLDPCANILSMGNDFYVSSGASLFNGNNSRNVRSREDTAAFRG